AHGRSSSCAPGWRESNADRKSISVGQRDPIPGFCRDRTIAHFFEMTAIVCANKVFGFAECFSFFDIILFLLKQ
ncbi:MAG TPA: hypothetical protein PK158_02305, partial [Spirochaetota bacterium]|nr:hypothetical protein [Spirochaetota bacterium]